MLWVVTFSVFLPSLTSSSVVWVKPSAAQKPSSVAQSQMFFTIGLLWLKFMTPKTLLRSWSIYAVYARDRSIFARYCQCAGGPRMARCDYLASSYFSGLLGVDHRIAPAYQRLNT